MESKIRGAFLALAALSVSTQAQALTAVTPSDLSALTTSNVETLLKTTAIAGQHRAYMPATALGVMVGIDIGADVTYLSIPTDFTTALQAAAGASASIPSGLVLPKLNVHKGLPMGIDIGGTFMSLSSGGSKIFSTYGGDLKWAFVNNAALPSIAARASYSASTVYFLDTSVFALDVLISKNLMVIDPYAGVGFQRWSGTINVPTTIPQLPASVSADASGVAAQFFGGLKLNLAIMKITAEANYSTAGLTTFGGKFSIGF